jgi:acyl carrier protein
MNDMTQKLTQCFLSVFPDLPEASVSGATQESVPEWDSVASITLINVIEEEFGVTVDLERMGEFTSYAAIESYMLELTA